MNDLYCQRTCTSTPEFHETVSTAKNNTGRFSVEDGNLHNILIHTRTFPHSNVCRNYYTLPGHTYFHSFSSLRIFRNTSDLKRETHIHYIYTRKFTLHCLQSASCPALLPVVLGLFPSAVLSSRRRGWGPQGSVGSTIVSFALPPVTDESPDQSCHTGCDCSGGTWEKKDLGEMLAMEWKGNDQTEHKASKMCFHVVVADVWLQLKLWE